MLGPAVLAMAAALVWAPGSARAGVVEGPGETPTGYKVEVSIHFSGEAAPGGASSHIKVLVAPSCWWAPAPGPYTDAQAMLDWYDGVTGGLQTRGIVDMYGPRRVWKEQADAEAAGTADISWYRAYCKNPDDYTKFGVDSVEGVDPLPGEPANFVTFLYHPYNAGVEPPAPRVPPEELARAAWQVMELAVPEIGRNPMIKSPGDPTLVGLPTWLWVTNPEAVGGKDLDGDLHIRADIEQPDGQIWAEVKAHTRGLNIGWRDNSGRYGKSCTPAPALTEYTSGASNRGACTVVFRQASTGQTVAARAAWHPTWTGSNNDGVHSDLPVVTRTANLVIPVAEVQNIVTR